MVEHYLSLQSSRHKETAFSEKNSKIVPKKWQLYLSTVSGMLDKQIIADGEKNEKKVKQ